jgi:hypothetical protein
VTVSDDGEPTSKRGEDSAAIAEPGNEPGLALAAQALTSWPNVTV